MMESGTCGNETSEGAAISRIQVRGVLDESLSERLGGMKITTDRSDEQQPVTTLEGFLRDQAALSGVLNTLYELHVPVLAVERVKE